MAYKLTDKDRRDIETDERLDASEDTERRYPKNRIVDAIYSPIDWLAGTPSSEEIADAKNEYYDELRESRNRR